MACPQVEFVLEFLLLLCTRELHTHQITLTKEENLVYQKILDFSRKALEQYIKSQEQKMREGYDRKSEQVTEKKLPEIAITYLDWLYSYLIQE